MSSQCHTVARHPVIESVAGGHQADRHLASVRQDSVFATVFKALLPLLIIAIAAYFALGKKS